METSLSKVDVKELKRLKKEKKRVKEAQTIAKLEQRKNLLESSKPVPKNILASSTDASKPSGRPYTVSMAVPGSILDNAQTGELKAYLAGQVARAAAIFNVDEVVVFADSKLEPVENDEDSSSKSSSRGVVQLARILQYLECPQYLRKHFFPIHDDLKYAGVLNPTDMPHHLRADEESLYREGVVVERHGTKEGCSMVNIGLRADCQVKRSLRPGLRVTVRLAEGYTWDKRVSGEVVSPSEPRTSGGLYWGYSTRIADSLSTVLAGCPYKGGYDLTLGTSEKGTNLGETELTKFNHLLVVFGGVAGLEAALEADEKLEASSPASLFDHYLNVCPDQGSRTIRTEEAIIVTWAALQTKIKAVQSASRAAVEG